MNQSPDRHAIPKLDCINPEQFKTAREECERLLMQGERLVIEVNNRGWANRFPNAGGVYGFFEKGELVYVGEGVSLSKRLSKLKSTGTHTLRRKIGRRLLRETKGVEAWPARQAFPDDIEQQITPYIKKNPTITAVRVPFGRAEIEEYMTKRYQPIYNTKGKSGKRDD